MSRLDFVILAFVFCCTSVFATDKLLQANVLWRHGDRAPLFTYSTDRVKECDWAAPYGELTPLGMNQAYTKGLIMRNRYVNEAKLISPTYKSSEIYARSTTIDRALLSAYSVLAGLYSEAEVNFPLSKVESPSGFWQSVPVHTIDYVLDYLMNMERTCPKWDERKRERELNPAFKEYVRSIKPLFEVVRNGTGRDVPDVFELRLVQDTLKVARENNKPLPDWATDEVYEELSLALNSTDDYMTGYPGFGLPMDMDLIRLRGGPLLKEMIENMNATRNGTPETRLLHVYSGHDITVSSLFRNLDCKISVMGRGLPPYTAAVAVELWQGSNGTASADGKHDYQVQVLYSSGPLDEFVPVTNFVSGCPSKGRFCPWETFVARSREFVPDDIVELCTGSKEDDVESR